MTLSLSDILGACQVDPASGMTIDGTCTPDVVNGPVYLTSAGTSTYGCPFGVSSDGVTCLSGPSSLQNVLGNNSQIIVAGCAILGLIFAMGKR